MKFVKSIAVIFASSLAFCASSTAFADEVLEEFVCTFNDGKTMDDLMKVVDQWKEVMEDIKSGKDYQAWILTPIASDHMTSVIWMGQIPDMEAFGKLEAEYSVSEGGQVMDVKFDEVVTCHSRSIWRMEKVR